MSETHPAAFSAASTPAASTGPVARSTPTVHHSAPTVHRSAPAAHGAARAGRRPRQGLSLLVIATAQLMVVLDATVTNVALPQIQDALRFSGANLSWVVNAYALAFGGLLLLG